MYKLSHVRSDEYTQEAVSSLVPLFCHVLSLQIICGDIVYVPAVIRTQKIEQTRAKPCFSLAGWKP